MQIVPEVNPIRITLAREARGWTQQDLAEKIKIHRANVSRLENGEINVYEDTLAALSTATAFPPDFFKQQSGIVSANAAYRKRDHVAVKLLSVIEAKMNIIRGNIQFITRALDKEAPHLPVYEVTKERSPSQIAALVRKQWNLTEGIIGNLTQILESKGIIISSFEFGTDRVDSRNLITDDHHPIIFLNKNLLGDRLRYSLAYELGGLVMHTFFPVDTSRDLSKEANQFAAEFLMPKEDILKDFEGGLTLSKLAELKLKWKVSMISLLYRADDLGLLTPNQKRYLLQQFNERKIRRREPLELDIEIEQPSLLRNLINHYIKEYEIGIKQMAAFFAIPINDYLDYYG
jgi:Zn-dependent peptidase ImmA (M78 family)/transcriptional regulator with XRE-family HTH domain